MARDRVKDVADFWDRVVADFLAGRPRLPPPLDRWFDSYRPARLGDVQRDAFPEPYIGALREGSPAAVFLGLNPGRADLEFQASDRLFAAEIRSVFGSYSEWAASAPYLRPPWTT